MKHSKQRDMILKILQENLIHPTADKVFEIMRKEMANVSLATVYRNLNLLAEQGIVRKIEGLNGVMHFDSKMHKHHHFICKKCHKVYDVEYEMPADFIHKIDEQSDFVVEDYEIAFSGICKDCKKIN